MDLPKYTIESSTTPVQLTEHETERELLDRRARERDARLRARLIAEGLLKPAADGELAL